MNVFRQRRMNMQYLGPLVRRDSEDAFVGARDGREGKERGDGWDGEGEGWG